MAKVTAVDHLRLIEKLQQDIELQHLSQEDYEMKALVYKTQRDDLQREYTTTQKELAETVDHLQ